jgi:hypothetical protein
MRGSRFSKRVTVIEQLAKEQWGRPEPSQLHWEVLTPAEAALAQVLNERLWAVGVEGLTDEELDQAICLHERLAGGRGEPCVPEAEARGSEG